MAPASTKDQPLAETFFALRRRPHPRGLGVGGPAAGDDLTDEDFEGRDHHRRWLAGQRQIVSPRPPTTSSSTPFCLDRERPDARDSPQARLIAKMIPHNFYLRLNQRLGHPSFAFVLVDY